MSNEPGPTGQFPHGKLNDQDEGALSYRIAADIEAGVVRLDFGQPVAWIGFAPTDARALAFALLRHAGRIDGQITEVTLTNPDG